MAAERYGPWRLSCIETSACLEPLAILIDQRDEADRNVEKLTTELHYLIEICLGSCIQEVKRSERIETISLVLGNSGGLHALSLAMPNS